MVFLVPLIERRLKDFRPPIQNPDFDPPDFTFFCNFDPKPEFLLKKLSFLGLKVVPFCPNFESKESIQKIITFEDQILPIFETKVTNFG